MDKVDIKRYVSQISPQAWLDFERILSETSPRMAKLECCKLIERLATAKGLSVSEYIDQADIQVVMSAYKQDMMEYVYNKNRPVKPLSRFINWVVVNVPGAGNLLLKSMGLDRNQLVALKRQGKTIQMLDNLSLFFICGLWHLVEKNTQLYLDP